MDYETALETVGIPLNAKRVTEDIFGNEWPAQWVKYDPCDMQFTARLGEGSVIAINKDRKWHVGIIEMWRVGHEDDYYLYLSLIKTAGTTDYEEVYLRGDEEVWMEAVD
jgi:hypothetical protein